MRPPIRLVDDGEGRTASSVTRQAYPGTDSIDDDSGEDRTPTQLDVWRAARARKKHERAEIRRFTRRIRARRRWLVIVASAIALLTLLVGLAVYSPLMSVREIKVHGIERLDANEVTQALEQIRNKPIAQVTEAEVEEKLREFVLVQSYSVQRIPPGTVIVQVVERQPIGVIETGGKIAVVDGVGVTLWEDPAAANQFPKIETPPARAEEFAAIGQVLTAIPDELLAKIAEAKADSVDSVTFTMRDGSRVIWGSAEATSMKVEVLNALTAAVDSPASEIDVSSPERPVTR